MGLTCLRSFFSVCCVVGLFLSCGEPVESAETGETPFAAGHYVGRVEGDLVRIEASFIIPLPLAGPVEIPLHFGDAVVEKLDDTKTSLSASGDGKYSLLFVGVPAVADDESKEYAVKFKLTIPVDATEDDHGFLMHCPPTPITTFDLLVPLADQEIRFQPFSLPLSLEKTDTDMTQQTHVKARFGSTTTIVARWFLKNRVKPTVKPLVNVKNQTKISVSEKTFHSVASLEYRVLRGEVDQLKLAVPKSDRILDVSAPESGLLDWNVETEEKRQLVTIDLIKGLTGALRLEVHTEADRPAESIQIAGIGKEETVHGIHAVDVEREEGLITLDSADGSPLVLAQRKSALVVEDGSKQSRRSRTRQFRYFSPDLQLVLAAPDAEKTPRSEALRKTVVEQAAVEVVAGGADGNTKANYRCRYQLNPGEEPVLIKLPIGSKASSVMVNGAPYDSEYEDKENPAESGTVSINFSGNNQGDSPQNQQLTLIFQVPLGPPPFESHLGKMQLPLPELYSGQVDDDSKIAVPELNATVWIPERFALVGQPENFSSEPSQQAKLFQIVQSKTQELPQWQGDGNAKKTDGFKTVGRAYHYRQLTDSDSLTVLWCDMPFAGWALSLPLFLIGLVLSKTSWRNKLGVLLVIWFAAAMISLDQPDWVFHGWIAARFGLIAMLGLWLIQSVPGRRIQQEQPAQNDSSHSTPVVSAPSMPTVPVIPPPKVFDILEEEFQRGKK